MSHKLIGSIAAAAVASLIAGGAATPALAKGKGSNSFKCEAGNACKGKSECKSADNASCKGHNECKGKGMIMTKNEAACKEAQEKNKAM